MKMFFIKMLRVFLKMGKPYLKHWVKIILLPTLKENVKFVQGKTDETVDRITENIILSEIDDI